MANNKTIKSSVYSLSWSYWLIILVLLIIFSVDFVDHLGQETNNSALQQRSTSDVGICSSKHWNVNIGLPFLNEYCLTELLLTHLWFLTIMSCNWFKQILWYFHISVKHWIAVIQTLTNYPVKAIRKIPNLTFSHDWNWSSHHIYQKALRWCGGFFQVLKQATSMV